MMMCHGQLRNRQHDNRGVDPVRFGVAFPSAVLELLIFANFCVYYSPGGGGGVIRAGDVECLLYTRVETFYLVTVANSIVI